MSEVCAAPDARHFIWVARNLLWQANQGIVNKFGDRRTLSRRALCNEIMEIIEAIDRMRDRLKKLDPVPCLHTTMPPCTDNAWKHFLAHVQECYLPETKKNE